MVGRLGINSQHGLVVVWLGYLQERDSLSVSVFVFNFERAALDGLLGYKFVHAKCLPNELSFVAGVNNVKKTFEPIVEFAGHVQSDPMLFVF
jgi:hypothetical protein